MKNLRSILALLFLVWFSGCGLLDDSDADCPITAEPLEDEDYTLNQNVAYHNNSGGDVYYTVGECFGGSAEYVWDYSGEIYEMVGNKSFELLTSGTMCVELESGGRRTERLCKDITVHRKHVWARHYVDFPGGKTKQSVSMTINGDVYSGFGNFNNWYRLDTVSFRWQEMANIPNLVDFTAFAGFAIDGKGYLVGNNSILYEYDPATNTWTNKGQLPQLVSTILNLGGVGRENYNYPVLGVSEGGKGYFGIGNMYHLYEYTPETNEWKQLTDRPERGEIGDHSFAYKGKIYAGKYEYDIATDTWKKGGDDFSVDVGFSPGFVPFKGLMYGGLAGKTVQFDGEKVTEVDLEGATQLIIAPTGLYGSGAVTGDIIVFPRLMGVLGYDENSWMYYLDK